MHDAPTALRAKQKDARRLNTGTPKSHGTPCAMVLRLLRDLPGEPSLFATVARELCHHGVVPCIGGTGPHGLTVRGARTSRGATRPSQPASRSGDEWPLRPPCRGGLASLNHKFCLSERYIFLRGALDIVGQNRRRVFGVLPVVSWRQQPIIGTTYDNGHVCLAPKGRHGMGVGQSWRNGRLRASPNPWEG